MPSFNNQGRLQLRFTLDGVSFRLLIENQFFKLKSAFGGAKGNCQPPYCLRFTLPQHGMSCRVSGCSVPISGSWTTPASPRCPPGCSMGLDRSNPCKCPFDSVDARARPSTIRVFCLFVATYAGPSCVCLCDAVLLCVVHSLEYALRKTKNDRLFSSYLCKARLNTDKPTCVPGMRHACPLVASDTSWPVSYQSSMQQVELVRRSFQGCT